MTSSQAAARDVDSLTAALHNLAWTMRHAAPTQAGVPSVATSDLAVLKGVLASPGLTVGALAASLGLQRPNVSSSLRTLESQGLVERAPDAADRRRTLVQPTPRARNESQAIASAWRSVIAEAVEDLPQEDVDVLLRSAAVLAKLNEAVRTRLAAPAG